MYLPSWKDKRYFFNSHKIGINKYNDHGYSDQKCFHLCQIKDIFIVEPNCKFVAKVALPENHQNIYSKKSGKKYNNMVSEEFIEEYENLQNKIFGYENRFANKNIYGTNIVDIIEGYDLSCSNSIKKLINVGLNVQHAIENEYVISNLENIKLLLENGAKISENTLNIICHKGNTLIIKYLVNNGVDKDILLDKCIRYGHSEIVKWFTSIGAKVNEKSFDSLIEACRGWYNADIVLYLLENMYIVLNKKQIKNLFETTCYNNCYLVAKYLMDNGYNIKNMNKYLIEVVIERCNAEFVHSLISNGVDISEFFDELFVKAVRKGNLDVIKYLAINENKIKK
ncbi:repeat protein [Moumouvirus goulette]|uniref:Repeat protein n=1 Tax=Moumouvirus goulette TaxID=1247379 RepID=M1PNW3_9VIRU|nr:repeat protein [Moumouvirus goulette]AGF85726.1 repeat protein [Moumouvirus goulette]